MDSARMAAQSDPDQNAQFKRRWSGPPQKRKSPRIAGTIQRAKFENISSDNEDSATAKLVQWARRLEVAADREAAMGHEAIATRLLQQAAELREGNRA